MRHVIERLATFVLLVTVYTVVVWAVALALGFYVHPLAVGGVCALGVWLAEELRVRLRRD